MPAKRKYNVKGTNDFLVLGAIFFFLCLWSIKDAWFPSPKVLKKHPLEIQASFETAGSVEKIFVKVGDPVGEEQQLAKLRTDRMTVEYDEAKKTYTEANKKQAKLEFDSKTAMKTGASEAEVSKTQERLAEAKVVTDEALATVTALRMSIDSAVLLSPSKGEVKEIKVGTHSMVGVGDTVITLDPKDHFYLFNKSLAIFSFLAFWVFLAIHILAR